MFIFLRRLIILPVYESNSSLQCRDAYDFDTRARNICRINQHRTTAYENSRQVTKFCPTIHYLNLQPQVVQILSYTLTPSYRTYLLRLQPLCTVNTPFHYNTYVQYIIYLFFVCRYTINLRLRPICSG